ncbi:hypothetical protein EI460_22815 [Salmonella enterica subsp. enterica]|nr:hypothetical protein LFZ24_05920 [Salmonella enterica subsp. enterica serovar Krefeld str. SA20030536]AXD05305.1 hypothetical protein LFZ28_15170 [Salmonella enterica subsp. enterica serovar Milwaukee str. SA19950795]EAA5380214.1 hypothetical protein [Salmonella enterica subsp. enterica serovar Canada]EAA5455724.1 hypothetical protein [Salmonella enterica subsp. enterica]EAM9835982.1 hypothetical protein [Salmonella enterica]EBH8891011.1 hypothetical protein [Salmonella enterica subsp. ente
MKEMLNLESLSIGWIDGVEVSNNQVVMNVISFDKELKIKCERVLSLTISYPYLSLLDNNTEMGNVVEVLHEYRVVRDEDFPQYHYNDYDGAPLNVVRVEGDYTIKLVCETISILN